MESFVFQSPTKFIFGRDTENQIGAEVKKFGSNILLHYGGGSIKKSGLYDRVTKSLKEAGVDFVELGGVKPNPRLSFVRQGIEICRNNNVDFILAVGGGSVIDSSKAIALGTVYSGDVWDFYTGKAVPREALPLGVILTIPAAGSEGSPGSVITNEDGWYKRAVNNDILRSKVTILNPELTFTLPPHQTACGAADIMAHIMERYFTNVRDVDFTDRLCEAGLKTVIKNVSIALKEPENFAARAEIMWASTIAHNNLFDTGRIGDWASHDIEHEISGIYDVAHGAGLAVIFPAWMKYNYKHDVNRFVQFATRVWNIEPDFNNPEKTALEGIASLKNFFKSIGLPTTFEQLNVPFERAEEMAAKATENGPVGQFVKLYKDDVYNIYKLAR